MAAPMPDVFAHADPWAEVEFLALPVDRRVELLDGALLVSPSARHRGETGPRALAYRLNRDHHAEVACAEPGQRLVLTEPIAVMLDLAALAAATRPSR
jgi:hypothetical protein